jgi:hypothetical protein
LDRIGAMAMTVVEDTREFLRVYAKHEHPL